MNKLKISIVALIFFMFLSIIPAGKAFIAPWPIYKIVPGNPYMIDINVIEGHVYRFDCKINNTKEVYFALNRSASENLFFERMTVEFSHYYYKTEKTETILLSISVNETTGNDTLISYSYSVNYEKVLPIFPEVIFIIIFIGVVSVLIFFSIRKSRKEKQIKKAIVN